MLEQAAVLQHQLDDLAQAPALGLLAQHVDLGDEGRQLGTGRAAQAAGRIMQRTAQGARGILQLLDRTRANAARRKIHHAQQAGVVVRVVEQAQIGQRMLDLGALEEAQATIDAIRQAGAKQRGLDDPALRVAAIQQRDLLARPAFGQQALDLVDQPVGLGEVAGRFNDPDRLAGALLGAQVLAQTTSIVLDQMIGSIQDVAVAAVVLLKLDLVTDLELAHEIGHVADARAAKGVDALVVVTDREHGVAGRHETAVLVMTRQQLEPGILQLVGVLELVDQDMAKAPLVMLAHRVLVAQQLVAAQHQLAEVDHALALALGLVELVEIDLAPLILVARAHLVRAQSVLLAAGDEPLQLLRGIALLVDLVLLAQALDRAELVLHVEDLEALRQVGQLPVRAQQPMAQAVEGADPHAAHIDRQHGRQAGQHLLGRLVGEGHGQQAARRELAGLQQPGNARGQHARLAGAGASQDQRGLGRQRDGSQLLGVEALQQRRLGK